MKYLLQVSTGSFSHTSVEAQTVAEKLERCLDRIAVEKVIFGWSPDRAVNESLVGLLEKRGIEKYIWLPVFSEIHRPETSDALVDVTGQSGKAISHLCQGESFDFVCPSSGRNRERAVHVFGQLAGNLPWKASLSTESGMRRRQTACGRCMGAGVRGAASNMRRPGWMCSAFAA